MAAGWKLTFITDNIDAAEAALDAYGATIWATDKQESGVSFEVYFETEPDISTLYLPNDANASLEPLPDIDWVSESQKGLPPVIAPPFYLHGTHDAPRRGGWRNIEMQAGLAFGSGHHGTTLGCIILLADYLKRHKPRHIADIGCGTGILAIAAAKAGCRHILASDSDPVAITVTRENMQLNNVSPHIRAFPAMGMAHRRYHGRRFDLILANILASPLRFLASDFERHLTDRGQIIIAGLLNEQARSVIARYRQVGLRIEQKIIIGPWTSLRFKR